LHETQQQIAAMVANIPGCVYRGVVHPDGRIKLLYTSVGEEELSGLNSQEIMKHQEDLRETLLTGSQADFYEALTVAAASLEPITQEYPIASPQGEMRWVRNSARYSLMDNGDVMIDGVAIDISDCLRHSFASCAAAEERLRALEQAIAQSAGSIAASSHTSS
jgi:PAS domain-containing protein